MTLILPEWAAWFLIAAMAVSCVLNVLLIRVNRKRAKVDRALSDSILKWVLVCDQLATDCRRAVRALDDQVIANQESKTNARS